MAGELRLDEGGLTALVRELQMRGITSDEHAAQADAALAAATGAVSSPPLAASMQRLHDRFRGRSADIGDRMTSLSTSLTVAATAITATDGTLADTARSLGK